MRHITQRIRHGAPALAALGPLVLVAFAQTGHAATAGGRSVARYRLRAVLPAAQSTSAPEATRTVIDATGRRVAVPIRVRRVVSLAPNITDILYALGEGDKIAGTTNFATIPPGAARKPSVGDPIDPSLEEIVSLKPDLVFVSKTINHLDTVLSLDRLRIPVYATDTRTVEGMLGTIERVAGLIGAKQAGEALEARLGARLERLRARLAGRKPKLVLFVEWEDPLITTGRDTFLADALRWAGAESVVNTREHWPHVSLEEIVHLQPEDLIFPASAGSSASEIREALLRRPGWKELKAVQQGRVVLVSDAINRPSPPIVEAIEELARKLHPGAFGEEEIPDAKPAPEAPRWNEARDGQYERAGQGGWPGESAPRSALRGGAQ